MTAALDVAVQCPNTGSAEPTFVSMGQLAVAGADGSLRTVGLGSCVAVIIFAPSQQLAAMAHCMLPECGEEMIQPGKYANSAVPALLDALKRRGATAPYSAILVGGASMFANEPHQMLRDIAGSNLDVARAALQDVSIPIRAEATGGNVGRSVMVDVSRQRVCVQTIRSEDLWL
jgi:chemotaxis protein CheD